MFRAPTPMQFITNQKVLLNAQIGSRAPHFRAATRKGAVYFPEDYSGKWVILFCLFSRTSGTDIIGIISLLASENEFEELLISDPDNEILKLYGVIQSRSDNFDLSGIVYFLDPDASIRAIVNYPLTYKSESIELNKLIAWLQRIEHFSLSLPSDFGLDESWQTDAIGSKEDKEFDNEMRYKNHQPCDCFYCASL